MSNGGAPGWLVTAGAWSWRVLVIAGAIGLITWALSHVMLVVLPLFIAMLLATVLIPLSERLERLHIPRSVATLLAVVGFLALVAGLIALIVPRFVAQLDDLTEGVRGGIQRALDLAGNLGLSDAQLETWVSRAQKQIQSQARSIGGGLLAGAVVAVQLVSGFLLTLVMTFFVVKDRDRITAWFTARTPENRRDDARAVAGRGWQTLAGYFRGQAIIAVADAIGIGIGLLLIGMPLVLPLAVLTLIGGFFPIVGAVVAGSVAVLVALVSGGLIDALLVVGVVVAVQQLEGNILQPLVMGRVVPLHPLVILVAVTAGAVLAGVVGAFLSVPIAAVIAATGNEVRLRREAAAA